MVPLYIFQHHHPRTLQLQRTRYLGRYELARRWWGTVTTSSQRWQCSHVLLDGCELLLQ